MNKLKNCFSLSHRLTVYVPSTKNVDEKINNKRYVEKVSSELSKLFGGATATSAVGYWQSETKGLVREKTTMVFAYIENLTDEAIDSVVGLAEELKKELEQESIAIELDGIMYFV